MLPRRSLTVRTVTMADLIDRYDAALFDLDGVIYLGPVGVDGAAEGVAALRDRGVAVAFVTNNAARTPQAVAKHLISLGIPASVDDIVTSSQAIARIMVDELGAGAKVLVTGTAALAEQIRAVGLTTVASYRDRPVAIVQGYDPGMTQPRIDEACFALQRGAAWYASNTDLTRPTNLGMVPGAGAQIAMVATTTHLVPTIAGKPFRPLLDEAVRRLGAQRPIFIGDRLDTDIEGACNTSMDSLLVFTGTHGKSDLVAANARQRPTHIGFDIRSLCEPAREVLLTLDGARCGTQHVRVEGRRCVLVSRPQGLDQQLDAVWAAAQLAWVDPGLGTADLLTRLDLIP